MRYFFNCIGQESVTDDEGTECADASDARKQAVLYAIGTVKDDPALIWATGELRVEVIDDLGKLIWTIVVKVEDAAPNAPASSG